MVLHDELQKVFTGDLTPEQYCQELADQFTEEFNEGVVPAPIPRTVA